MWMADGGVFGAKSDALSPDQAEEIVGEDHLLQRALRMLLRGK